MAERVWRCLRRGWPAIAFAVVYLWAFPYFGAMKSANELPRVLLAEEIVRDGRLDLDARLDELASRFDIATTPDGRHYSNKAPGVSLLAVPVHAAHRALAGGAPSIAASTWAMRIFVVTLPCLLFLVVVWRVAGRFAADAPLARRRALVAYGLGCMALPYGVLFFSHALAAAAAGASFAAAVALVRDAPRRPRLLALACGACAGAAVLIDYQGLLAALAIGTYLLGRTRGPRRWTTVGLALVAALVPLGALAAYHAAAFGAPWRTGYAFAADPAHRQGVLGIVGPNRLAMWNATLSPSNGLLVLTPWVVLAVVGAVAIARDPARRARLGAEAATCAVIAALYLLFIGSLVPSFGRAGWSVGPRYVGVALPFLAWLAAAGFAALERRRLASIAASGLVVAAAIVHVVAATSFPHWPDSFANPLYEVSFRALGEGLAPRSLGGALGLDGPLGLLPIYLAAAALLGWAIAVPGRRAASALGGAAIGVALIGAMALLPRTRPDAARERRFDYVRRVWEPVPAAPLPRRDPGGGDRPGG
jgi:hypothetical protein